MVLPLKLTQFYGHSLPRPRIYSDVKFHEHRVDPPPSVNEALLSWASDAHWSMGGLSFKRLRSQGKFEGNVRRLRAFVEEDEDNSGADMVKPSVKEGKSLAHATENLTSSTRKEGGRSVEKRKFNGEQEMVEATPARKLRRKGFVDESDDEELPLFVPATEERAHKTGQVKPVPFSKAAPSPSNALKKRVPRSPSKETAVAETPSTVFASAKRRKGKLFTAATVPLRGSKGFFSTADQTSKGSDGERLTRSATKTIPAAEGSPVQPSKTSKALRARKVILANDGESSDSDDGLEEFLQEKSRPLRRSSRLVKTEEGRSSAGSDSD